MHIEEIIGSRIQSRRDQLRFSQAKLGELMERTLGKPWTRQAVSLAEKGGRSFTAAELFALAEILDMPIARFFLPLNNFSGDIELHTGETVKVSDYLRIVGGPPTDASPDTEELRRSAMKIVGAAAELGSIGDDISKRGTAVWSEALTLASQLGGVHPAVQQNQGDDDA